MIERLRVRTPAGAAGETSAPVLTFCADSHSVSVPPPCFAVARKRPQSFCQSAGNRLHLSTQTTLTQRSWSGLTMLLSRYSMGTYPETSPHAICQNNRSRSSQFAEPLSTDPGLKSAISVRDLISTKKKKKKKERKKKKSAGGE